MLAALRVESFAIIDAVEVRFGPGLNVLTGETGAGKSILVDALGLLLGGRADPEAIRAGRDEASVEGIFTGGGVAARAREAGLPAEGDELLVRRTISRTGRARVHVNGALATVGVLSQLLRGVVDVVGQHEHVSLLRRERHLDLLDAHGAHAELVGAHRVAHRALTTAIAERDRLLAEQAERARRADYLAFQLRELEELAPGPGEDEALCAERRVLAAAERLRTAASAAAGALYVEDGSAFEVAGAALRRLDEAAAVDPSLGPVRACVAAARAELEEAGRQLARYAERAGGDPGRLAALDERLEALRALSRKHGGSLAEAIRRREDMRAELAALEAASARLGSSEAELEGLAREASRTAAALARARRAAARSFEQAVGGALRRLSMDRARFEVGFGPPAGPTVPGAEAEPLSARGREELEFLLSSNVGEELRPLARIASGGELSRVLLALKWALSAADPVETHVFDEVDAGIGGATALALGRVLGESARDRQVLCVTHLPQVAAFASTHLHVEKEVHRGRTVARVVELDEEGRRRVLAQLLSGTGGAPAALAAAGELLAQARGPAAEELSGIPFRTALQPRSPKGEAKQKARLLRAKRGPAIRPPLAGGRLLDTP